MHLDFLEVNFYLFGKCYFQLIFCFAKMDEIKTKLIQDLKALENELDKFRKIRAKTIDLLKQVAQDLDDRKQK